MSKTTNIRTGSVFQSPTQNGDRSFIPDGSVSSSKIQDSAVTRNKLAASSLNLRYADKASSYTLDSAIDDFIDFTATATATLPTAIGIIGKSFYIYNTLGGYNVTLATTSGQTIGGSAAGLILSNKNENIVVISDGANWLVDSIKKNPTIQKFTSGSGTYTTPAGVSYIRVRMAGGGGGSGGSGTSGNGSGTNGNTTTFGTSLLTCTGGGLSAGGAGSEGGGAGGAATINSPAVGLGLSGGSGGIHGNNTAAASITGGPGGVNSLGAMAMGRFGASAAGQAGYANTGGGSSGAGSNTAAITSGGGGAGAYLDAIINSPSSSYSYAVGAGGTGGTAGTSGFAGGAGGSGIIIVEEYY